MSEPLHGPEIAQRRFRRRCVDPESMGPLGAPPDIVQRRSTPVQFNGREGVVVLPLERKPQGRGCVEGFVTRAAPSRGCSMRRS